MAKTLCEWKKTKIEEDFLKLIPLVDKPRFICRKCARAANESKYLCKPRAIPNKSPLPDPVEPIKD